MPIIDSTKTDGGPSPGRATMVAHLTEGALLKRARNRDVAAFEELVARTEVQLYRVAMRYVHNESDAQEVLQDSYLSAWGSLAAFEGRAQFGSWMHKIVVNASLMRLRSRNRHPEVAINDIGLAELHQAIGQASPAATGWENWPDRPDEQLQSAELLHRIEIAVDSLPQDLKAIFVLRAVREVSTGDSATTLGVSVAAAKTRLHRARRVLRQSLCEYVAG
jgi:RNA polymerase sigma-70 factor, ECF subfamily